MVQILLCRLFCQVFCGFPQSLQAHVGMLPKPWLLPSRSFQVHYSLILSFSSVQSEVLKESLHKSERNINEMGPQFVLGNELIICVTSWWLFFSKASLSTLWCLQSYEVQGLSLQRNKLFHCLISSILPLLILGLYVIVAWELVRKKLRFCVCVGWRVMVSGGLWNSRVNRSFFWGRIHQICSSFVTRQDCSLVK